MKPRRVSARLALKAITITKLLLPYANVDAVRGHLVHMLPHHGVTDNVPARFCAHVGPEYVKECVDIV